MRTLYGSFPIPVELASVLYFLIKFKGVLIFDCLINLIGFFWFILDCYYFLNQDDVRCGELEIFFFVNQFHGGGGDKGFFEDIWSGSLVNDYIWGEEA